MIITIAELYGSGGRDIGEQLAARLGYRFYDRELLTLAASESGIHPEIAKQLDEKAAGSLTYSAFFAAGGGSEENLPLNQKLAAAQFQLIRSLAQNGNCVFLGRCADMILRKRSDLVRLFLHAPLEWRKQRVVRYYGIPERGSEKLIRKEDKARSRYVSFFTQNNWGKCESYDFSINTSLLGINGTANQLAQMLERLRLS